MTILTRQLSFSLAPLRFNPGKPQERLRHWVSAQCDENALLFISYTWRGDLGYRGERKRRTQTSIVPNQSTHEECENFRAQAAKLAHLCTCAPMYVVLGTPCPGGSLSFQPYGIGVNCRMSQLSCYCSGRLVVSLLRGTRAKEEEMIEHRFDRGSRPGELWRCRIHMVL
jgi:hypothetical protein